MMECSSTNTMRMNRLGAWATFTPFATLHMLATYTAHILYNRACTLNPASRTTVSLTITQLFLTYSLHPHLPDPYR